MSQESVTRLRSWMQEQGLDAFLVVQPQNRSYLSGWLNDDDEGAGVLLIGQTQQILMTTPIYAEAATSEARGWEVIVPATREYAPELGTLAQKYEWQKIGFEATAVLYSEYMKYGKAGAEMYEFLPVEEDILGKMRQVKRPDELALLKRAIAITDETFSHLCQWIQVDMTEKEVETEIARKMIALGADSLAFSSIVASGPNGSMPHAHPSSRRIQRGELVTIDMGARYKGYCGDMTRTICLGEPAEPRMREVYAAVLTAMKTCEAGLRAGISGKAADALARNALKAENLDTYYVHSTGHGVGLQIHEGPNLSARASEDVMLPVGAVVTVEPGVYISGWSGTRVEDCVLLKEDGVEVLTQSSTDLVLPR